MKSNKAINELENLASGQGDLQITFVKYDITMPQSPKKS